MEKIWITRVVLHNLCGHEHQEFKAGGINVLSGRNGSGKSGFLKSLRNVFTGGSAAHLLRNPKEPAWAIVEMSDGFVARKDITPSDPGPSKTELSLSHPDSGPVSRSATYLKGLVDDLGVDPLALDRCRPQDRAAYLQKILSVSVTQAELEEAAGRQIKMVGEGFQAIAQAATFLYDERTGENRIVRTATEANEKLAEIVLPLHDVSELASLRAEREKLAKWREEQLRVVEMDTADAISNAEKERIAADGRAKEARAVRLSEADREFEAELARITAIQAEARRVAGAMYAAELATARAEEQITKDKARESAEASKALVESHALPKLADLAEKITRASLLAEENARITKTVEMIRENRVLAEAAEQRSVDLSRGLARLEELRLKKLSELPVKELEIRDGEVWGEGIDGRMMPWEQLNTARRYELSLVAEAARSGPLALQIVDNVESVDAEAWPEFVERCKARGLQVFMARVTPGDFNIEADPEVKP